MSLFAFRERLIEEIGIDHREQIERAISMIPLDEDSAPVLLGSDFNRRLTRKVFEACFEQVCVR